MVVVIGGNSGIGKAAAIEMVKRGANVLMAAVNKH
ncbi:SDR family NAD(P)-dependent oxidoreductase [Paenibacillus sp. Soil787]